MTLRLSQCVAHACHSITTTIERVAHRGTETYTLAVARSVSWWGSIARARIAMLQCPSHYTHIVTWGQWCARGCCFMFVLCHWFLSALPVFMKVLAVTSASIFMLRAAMRTIGTARLRPLNAKTSRTVVIKQASWIAPWLNSARGTFP
jgi:hypothetical protein